MPETRDGPRYDLEDRTYQFAERVRAFVRELPRTICNREDAGQLVRASGSVGVTGRSMHTQAATAPATR